MVPQLKLPGGRLVNTDRLRERTSELTTGIRSRWTMMQKLTW